jgi:benzoyl-CoA reductase/2-hydroxyglutaryl-CoA dehydratase subunit BcrC/BadD/HgdB
MKKIGDVWEYLKGPQVFKLGVPYEHDKDFELEYFRDRLHALKERLEAVTGNAITTDKLSEAVDVYNRLRRLLRTLGETRRNAHQADGESGISALDFARLNHASFYADPVAMAAALEEISVALLSGTDLPAGPPGAAATRPRLLLMGPNLAAGDYDLFTLVDNAGADIVVEDIFEGIRDYWQTVDVSGDEDPVDALARAYLIDKRPAAFMRGSLPTRLGFALDLIRGYAVSGVLWYQLVCCEFYDEEARYFEMALRERGIPMLTLESDYHALDSGPLRTRLAAFVETLQGGPLHGELLHGGPIDA